MSSQKLNINIEQGTTFSYTFPMLDANGNSLNVAGYTAAAQLRKTPYSANSVAFSTALSNGSLVISLDANTSSNVVEGIYMFDVKVTDSSNVVTRRAEGLAIVSGQITHS